MSQGKPMSNLSTAADIGSQIGALELDDHLESHSDGVLETAAGASFGPPPPTVACRSADIRSCM
jgi:hypothetical protein